MRIEVVEHEGKQAIKVGDSLLTKYFKFDTISQVLSWTNSTDAVLELRRKYVREGLNFKHAQNKAICRVLKNNPKNFLKHLNGLSYKIFVSNLDRKLVGRYCFSSRKRIDPAKISCLTKVYDKVIQAQKDGLDNIVPYIFKYNETPQQLKKRFGKGTWKKLCKFSMSRNKLIAYCSGDNLRKDLSISSSETQLLNVSSSLMKSLMRLCHDNFYQWATINCKGKYSDKKFLKNILQIYFDTEMLARQLGLKINQNWSTEKLKEKHDEFFQLLNNRKYSKDIHEWTKNVQKKFTYKDYEVILLDNSYTINEEGHKMHHCVGGYAVSSASGHYAVFSVQKNGERYSTIGMYRDPSGKLRFNQHYKHCNKIVDCEVAKEIPDFIIKEFEKYQ